MGQEFCYALHGIFAVVDGNLALPHTRKYIGRFYRDIIYCTQFVAMYHTLRSKCGLA